MRHLHLLITCHEYHNKRTLLKTGALKFKKKYPHYYHYNFTPPKVLTWTTSPKGGKDWVLVSCLKSTHFHYKNLVKVDFIIFQQRKCILNA